MSCNLSWGLESVWWGNFVRFWCGVGRLVFCLIVVIVYVGLVMCEMIKNCLCLFGLDILFLIGVFDCIIVKFVEFMIEEMS